MITIPDGFLIFATLAGPVLAVQAQKWIERARERRNQKLQLFSVLMTTRAKRVSPEHVQALNMIDLLFYRARSRADKDVIDKWKNYMDHLNAGSNLTEEAKPVWGTRGEDLFVELLFSLSQALGYKFDRVQLRRGIYNPIAHGELETAQWTILDGLRRVFAEGRPIPMNVVGFPVSQEALDLQTQLQKGIIKAISGEAALHVSVQDEGTAQPAVRPSRTRS